MRSLSACLSLLACAGLWMASASAAPDDWIAREKIRAGWIYTSDGAERLGFFKHNGLNTLITHAGRTEADLATFRKWAVEARRTGMHLFGVVGASFDGQAAGMRRCVFANGYESVLPCPLDDRYWDEVLTKGAVHLATEGRKADEEVSGVLIDWEMYANAGRGGQIYYTDACYCDSCFGGFLKSKGRAEVAVGGIPLADRANWLKAQGLAASYQPYLQAGVRARADRLRAAVAVVSPGFFLGFYPVPHNWHLVGVAQGLGTAGHPMVLWATSTYGGGGPRLIADDWKQELEKQQIHCYYCGGMLLRMYSSTNLARNMLDIARKTDGYWLFTVHTLCIRPEEQNGDYYLCAGTPDDYLREVRLANSEIDRLCADPLYLSELELLPEPVRYRHTGFDVGRYRPPKLVDKSTAPRGTPLTVPPLGLTVGNFLMLQLAAGETPALTFSVASGPARDNWGVSYTVLGPGKEVVQEGRLAPGQPYALSFRAVAAGLHTVVLTAGYYGRCQVETTTVPYALWTGDHFEVSGPGGTLYFEVPAGLKEFTLKAQCLWGTGQVNLKVLDPDGKVVEDQDTDAFVRSARLTVPTGGKGGQQWALRVGAAAGKSFRNIALELDPALTPAVTLRPDLRFVASP